MKHQIIVCGAGIVGLASALALARRQQRVAVLAPRLNLPPAEADVYHPRVYAISPASQRFLAGLGIWDALPAARLTPVKSMEIHGDGDGRVELNAWQAAQSQLAWIVESSEIERVLVQATRMFGIPWIEERAVGWRPGEVETESGQRLSAELFIGADGASSPLREAAGLKHTSKSYADIGLVMHLNAEQPHHGAALQWFRDDGVLALLPLPDTREGPQVSMVWSMREGLARELMALPEPGAQIERRLLMASEGRLGRLHARSRLHGFPLTLEQSQMVAPGIALVGDAAHRLHPLAGQGLNLGLGDAQALAEAVAGRETYRQAGDLRVLRRYQRARAEPVLAMRLATDGLQRLFAAHNAPAAFLRNAGMRLVDALPLVKRRLIEQASRN
ncbi:UbiH/UbiF family hydroxylase [Bordetella avium]|uniref:UbiH/UbiF family hydroxylase n=1 Tax=Bordetella avium TaxID=521 RepID=UPI000E0BB9D9|nr:UbiH/UbiF family hydroxylase [Bordetella avium]RIQ15274.1 UbiH/UbiF family hydroxylase [Bordetella avium]RIQ38615.1 UbiH/UbiF family hydroxylase [Bordetella avium]RIQ43155.1 UbiH/UbiF family hydroxylase [Bordetella avium]RIQ43910.1 UbiH/UbiF family hydroxylase [Bordetella avium]RIQ53175.1 UbiH/UbiF family hydroxylase [Bordetella avium]